FPRWLLQYGRPRSRLSHGLRRGHERVPGVLALPRQRPVDTASGVQLSGLEAGRSLVLVRGALARSARAGHGAARAAEGHALARARDRASRAAEEVRRRPQLEGVWRSSEWPVRENP